MSGKKVNEISKVLAVVVTYEPDLTLLRNVLDSVRGQVARVLVFDNASRRADVRRFVAELPAEPASEVVLRVSSSNVGIASGINAGFSYAREDGFDHVLILDQDSTLAPTMVPSLLAALKDLECGGVPVAAVGPVFEDRRTGTQAPFVGIGPFVNRKVFANAGEIVEADFLISSGSLVPLTVLDVIGGMDESLFIDNVDLEWSFRARFHGFRLFGIGDARMGHAIGDQLKTLAFPGGELEVSLHSPVRLYYMTRNRVMLYRRRETPFVWVTQDVPRMLLKFIGMSTCVAPRWQNCRHMLMGLADALRGRAGAFRD